MPPELDQKIRRRFDELIEEATDLIPEVKAHEADSWMIIREDFVPDECAIKYFAMVEKTSTLLNTMLGDSARGREMVKQLENRASSSKTSTKSSTLTYIAGTLHGLKNDYENGYLDSLEKKVVASISSDYLTQVDMLLGEGKSAQLGHIPAAVLCGAVLEDAIRRLCERQSISIRKRGGGFKKLTTMIDELQKDNALSSTKRDRLQSWAKLRNSAAHARFDEVDRHEVETMIVDVKNFLADYL